VVHFTLLMVVMLSASGAPAVAGDIHDTSQTDPGKPFLFEIILFDHPSKSAIELTPDGTVARWNYDNGAVSNYGAGRLPEGKLAKAFSIAGGATTPADTHDRVVEGDIYVVAHNSDRAVFRESNIPGELLSLFGLLLEETESFLKPNENTYFLRAVSVDPTRAVQLAASSNVTSLDLNELDEDLQASVTAACARSGAFHPIKKHDHDSLVAEGGATEFFVVVEESHWYQISLWVPR